MEKQLSEFDKNKQRQVPDPVTKLGIVGKYSPEDLVARIKEMKEGNRDQLFTELGMKGVDEVVIEGWAKSVSDEEERKKVVTLLADFRMTTDQALRKKIAKEIADFINR